MILEDLKINIESLEQRSIYRIEGDLVIDSIELDIGNCPLLKPLSINIEYVLQKRELFVTGRVRTTLECQCSRCLEPAVIEINGQIEAVYRPSEELKSLKREEVLEKLENVVYYFDPVIDLFERVHEAVVVEVPQKPLCKPDCKGLCPYCGENLNEHPEHRCNQLEDFLLEARMSLFKELRRGG
ncbi:MAG: hypothetical protein PWP37_408 [Thermotogota bacterium]|nr:hypothetical protein [Thermotogota bacterium]MDK2864216.1 hypothetical protein [Thermotogota bacterium]HCZ05647.1 DNA-binding protein [Thermotogota bacterium]